MPNPVEIVGTYRGTPATFSEGPAQILTDSSGRIITGSAGRATATATIANGASLSGAVDLGANYMATRITMPAAWTAAGMSFQVSADGSTYNEMRDNLGALVALTVAADYDFALDSATFLGARYIKVRSGTAAAAVNQGGARSIILMTVPI